MACARVSFVTGRRAQQGLIFTSCSRALRSPPTLPMWALCLLDDDQYKPKVHFSSKSLISKPRLLQTYFSEWSWLNWGCLLSKWPHTDIKEIPSVLCSFTFSQLTGLEERCAQLSVPLAYQPLFSTTPQNPFLQRARILSFCPKERDRDRDRGSLCYPLHRSGCMPKQNPYVIVAIVCSAYSVLHIVPLCKSQSVCSEDWWSLQGGKASEEYVVMGETHFSWKEIFILYIVTPQGSLAMGPNQITINARAQIIPKFINPYFHMLSSPATACSFSLLSSLRWS